MNRAVALRRLRDTRETWDVLVIGGGATGLGTALDAAARGHRTALLEQSDFAQATSSRSTKLIHGGVRYLRQGHLPLVRESLRERGRLLANAPHLVHKLPFIVPAYQWSDRAFYGIGLKLYDALAGRLGLGATQVLTRAETLAHAPTLATAGLRGGVLYWDAQFDDARLAIALAQTLAARGGVAANYVRVESLLKEHGRIAGVRARDVESGDEFELRARVVVNATGVFTDAIRRLDDTAAPRMIAASQGAHIVLPRAFLPGDTAVMVPKTADGRVLFAIPWHDRVLVGTTDTPVTETPLEPRPLAAELEFLLAHAGEYLSARPQASDILSTWAGLRPLVSSGAGGATSKLSRDHALVVSPSGLVTITGGKWTTYRRMAEDAVDRAVQVGGLALRPSVTHELALDDFTAAHRAALEQENAALRAPLHPRLPYHLSDVVCAARHEMARTVEDVLSRRTRALLLDARGSMEAAPTVAALLTKELGRDASWEAQQVAAFTALARGYMPS